MKAITGAAVLLVILATGCAMFGMWRSIPPPGGCDRCHTLEISTDWKASVKPVALTGEDGKPSWQRSESVIPPPPDSPLLQQMVSDEECFRCHREPDAAHRGRRGSYHHRQ